MDKSNLEMLNHLFGIEDWKRARKIVERELVNSPNDHWLLTRLSTTYYEERNYASALRVSKKAMRIAPRCPLVLWDYAASLDMLGKEMDAIKIWKKILNKGIKRIAYDECGEGIRWAKSLITDCLYRIGTSYLEIGNKKLAAKYLKGHLVSRRRGIPSLYSLRDVRKKLKSIKI